MGGSVEKLGEKKMEGADGGAAGLRSSKLFSDFSSGVLGELKFDLYFDFPIAFDLLSK
jgi:hypothetical protein